MGDMGKSHGNKGECIMLLKKEKNEIVQTIQLPHNILDS